MIAMACLDAWTSDREEQLVNGTQWAVRLRIKVDSGREENGAKSF
jgi:hypothetical protein